MTPDPFALEGGGQSHSAGASNAYCPDCDVKWRAISDEGWKCWWCGEERRPNPKAVKASSVASSAQSVYDAFFAAIMGGDDL